MPDYMNLTFLEKCQTQLHIFDKKSNHGLEIARIV